jgi:hypothetical protein
MRKKLEEVRIFISIERCGLSIVEVAPCALIEFKKSQSDFSEGAPLVYREVLCKFLVYFKSNF